MTRRTLVCICGTNRPGNFTSCALANIVDEVRPRGEVFEFLDTYMHPAERVLELEADARRPGDV